MNTVLDVIAAICLVLGALLSLSAGVALVRFPDLLSRMHAATKPQVLGLLLVLLGCGLRLRDTVDVTTLLLVAVFQMATAPVAAHMVGRAGYRAGRVRDDLLVTDELAGDAETVGEPSARPAADSGVSTDTAHHSSGATAGGSNAASVKGSSVAKGNGGGAGSAGSASAPIADGAGAAKTDGASAVSAGSGVALAGSGAVTVDGADAGVDAPSGARAE